MMVDVSIIIPFYNRADTLEFCLQSICNLSNDDYEVILVDDGSTDGSEEVCKQFCDDNPRFRYFRHVHGGVSSARNFGIDKSQGRWLTFVDSDDAVLPEHLDWVDMERDADWLIESFCAMDENDYRCRAYHPERFKEVCNVSDKPAYYYFTDFLKTGTPMFSVWGKFYKREICKKNGVRFREDLHWGEDQLFNLEYLRHISNVVHYPLSATYIQMDRKIKGSGQRLSSVLQPLDELYRLMLLNMEAYREFDAVSDGYNIRYYVNDMATCIVHSAMLAYTRHANAGRLPKGVLLAFTRDKVRPLFMTVLRHEGFIKDRFVRQIYHLVVKGYCKTAIAYCRWYGYVIAIRYKARRLLHLG